VPEWAVAKLEELTGLADPVRVLPRDEWCLGDGAPDAHGHRREYLTHLRPPMFTARVVELDENATPTAAEYPVNMDSGEVYQNGDMAICEVIWHDQPKIGEIVGLFEAACDFIDSES